MVIFQDTPGKPVAECHSSGFYWSKDDVGGGKNLRYKMGIAPVNSNGQFLKIRTYE